MGRMKTLMPDTSRSLSRKPSTTSFIGWRWLRGFSVMNIRPEFCAPEPPLNELTTSTLASARITAAARSCKRTISAKDVSSAASVVAVIWPMSSCGKNPFGTTLNSTAVATKVTSATANTTLRCSSAKSSDRVYCFSTELNPRSKKLTTTPCFWPRGSAFKKRLASMGTRVSDTKADTRMDRPTTTANSWNSSPITPGMKKIGIKTATSDVEMEMMVNPTSREPRSAALKGSSPFST